MSKKTRNWAVGTAVAAAAGYVAGILTAPKSGKETRKDIANKASKAKTEGEKQLKKLHSELNELIDTAEAKLNSTKAKANKGLKDAVESAKKTKRKTKLLLSALHDGDADDPDLRKMVRDAKKAKDNLAKFIKK